MKLEIVSTKTVNVTHLVQGTITWAGSRIQVARTISFTLVQDDRDSHVPVIDIDNGYSVRFYDDDGKLVFEGNIYNIEKD